MIAVVNIVDLPELNSDWIILEYDNPDSPGLVAVEYTSVEPTLSAQIFSTFDEFQSFKSSNVWRNL